MTALSSAWTLAFELSPIVLCGGVAQYLPGRLLPIISITEAVDFVAGVLGGGGPTDINDFFAHFQPLPGGTLAENQLGAYPFANQGVAGNAVIAQPQVISMLMICPARQAGGYPKALATMMLLTTVLNQHDSLGGTYTVITPKGFYTNLIRLRMVDVSTAQTHQAQNTYQLDFIAPLLTLEQAQSAQNSLMAQLTNGVQINGQPSWSGAAAAAGQPYSVGGVSIPAGASTPGTGTVPLTTTLSA